MNIALFGGTFDPIHRGHLAVARAALRRFRLDEVHFVPTHVPPHKQARPRAGFLHRYAMVALATAGEKRFLPSLLEAPRDGRAQPNYSLDTVRAFKKTLGKDDRLYFLLGMDAFAGIARWHQPRELLRECDFIVVSRPGHSLDQAVAALPRRAGPWGITRDERRGDERIVLRHSVVHLLRGVRQPASATAVRAAAAHGRPLAALVGREVAGYIAKTHLYRSGRQSLRGG